MQVLLADDQAKVRSALRLLLEHQPKIEILGEAVDATSLMGWVRAAHPDLVCSTGSCPACRQSLCCPCCKRISPVCW